MMYSDELEARLTGARLIVSLLYLAFTSIDEIEKSKVQSKQNNMYSIISKLSSNCADFC